ncbi:hypothetical protein B2A_14582, partial [mine drainage metagenome]|uniref:DNA-binding protein n=2 Tax=mine drainage metagenome TaxID=410659 RepID=T1AA13_9ZZZZ
MHYTMMTERHLADRWQVSLKTLRRWRLDNEGPVWHKLFHHVRYHEADILEFERRSARHLMTLLGVNREFKPAEPDATLGQGLDTEADSRYLSAKEIAEAASLPAILEWELAHSVVGNAAAAVVEEAEVPTEPPVPAKRWYELVREQDGERFDSAS